MNSIKATSEGTLNQLIRNWHRVAGVVLIVAAMMKIRGPISDLLHFAGNFGSSDLFLLSSGLAVAAFEFAAGIFIVTKGFEQTKRFFAALLFSIFAIAAAQAYWNGESDCGCFGALSIQPLYTFIVDVGIAFCCLFAAARGVEGWQWPSIAEVRTAGLRISLTLLATVCTIVIVEAVPVGIPRFNRDLVARSTPVIVQAKAGEWFEAALVVKNPGTADMLAFGGKESCGIRFQDSFPVAVKAGEIRYIKFRARTLTEARNLRIPMTIIIGHTQLRQNQLVFSAMSL